MELSRRDFIKTSALLAGISLGVLPKSDALPMEIRRDVRILSQKSNCTGCGICTIVCPINMKISKAEDFNMDNAELAIHVNNGQAEVDYGVCIACGTCSKNCPVASLAIVMLQI